MVKIKNSNFLPVTISALNVTLENYSLELGLMMHPSLIVASRSSKTVSSTNVDYFVSCPDVQVTVLQNATYVQPQANKIMLVLNIDIQLLMCIIITCSYICTKDHQYQSVVYIKARYIRPRSLQNMYLSNIKLVCSVSAKYTYLGQGSTALDDQSHFVPCSTVIAVPTAMQGQVT